MLVDHVGGLLNHCRRGADEWTVSSELSVDVGARRRGDPRDGSDVRVVGTARPLGGKTGGALAVCELAVGTQQVATALVRSFYIQVPAGVTAWPTGAAESHGRGPVWRI